MKHGQDTITRKRLQARYAKSHAALDRMPPPPLGTRCKTGSERERWAIQAFKAGVMLTDIARVLGVSKRSIIGQRHRNRWEDAADIPLEQEEAPSRRWVSTQRACTWVDGDPRESDWSYCGEPVADGQPYCSEHCGRVYANWFISRGAKSNKPQEVMEDV